MQQALQAQKSGLQSRRGEYQCLHRSLRKTPRTCTRAQQGTGTSEGTKQQRNDAASSQNGSRPQPGDEQTQQASSSASSEPRQEDESRYPSKDWTAGGWAGGEKGLRQFLTEGQQQSPGAAKLKGASTKPSSKPSKSSENDDPRRYPSKDRIGGLDGVTGGFAGGERGLRQFVEQGDLTFAEQSSRKQTSPVAIAGLLGLAATAGGILLTDSIDLGESFLAGKIPSGLATGKLDSNTRLALEIALGLLVVVAFLAGGKALVLRLSLAIQDRTASISRALIVLFFAIGVVAAARYILETS